MSSNEKLLARVPKTIYFAENENKVAVYARKPRRFGWRDEPKTVSLVKNTPVEKVRILGVDRSSKRRDLWSVEFPHEGRLLTTTISTLAIQSILTSSVPRTDEGWFVGPFSWAILNMREVTLVPVETPLGLEVAEAAKVYSVPYLKKEDAVPGCVYQTRSGERYAYLGELAVDKITSEAPAPWVIETVNFKAWARVYGENLLSVYVNKNFAQNVLETVVGKVDVSDKFFETERRNGACGYRSYMSFDDFKHFYSYCTIRRAGEACPEIPQNMSEDAWKTIYEANLRKYYRY